MPIITRQDGLNFAIYTYRELLAAKQPNLLRREIEFLREENGDYARFFEQTTGDFEAIFSKEPGYLLGETVWFHFDKPDNLILCEAMPGDENAILVVVRAGSVYLDALVSMSNLVDEFIALVTGSNQYDIYIHGDVPLARTASDEKFAFPDNFVKSFTELSSPVFNKLQPDEDLKLLFIKDAIEELDLPTFNIGRLVLIVAAAAVVGFIGWEMLKPGPAPVPVPKSIRVALAPTAPTDIYQDYKRALMTPAPSGQLRAIANTIRQLYSLPGWAPKAVAFDGFAQTVDLQSIGGGADILLTWVRTQNMTLTLQTGRAQLIIPVNVPNRSAPTVLFDLKYMLSRLYDGMKQTLPTGGVNIGAATQNANYSSVELTIQFNAVTLDVLSLLADELTGLPLVLKTVNLTVTDGLLAGQIDLSVLGIMHT